MIKHTGLWRDIVAELHFFLWAAQSSLRHNTCNLLFSISNDDDLCCHPRSIFSNSLHYSLVSLHSGSRDVKIMCPQRAEKSFSQGKWEHKRLWWVQGTMLEAQQQRDLVTPWHPSPFVLKAAWALQTQGMQINERLHTSTFTYEVAMGYPPSQGLPVWLQPAAHPACSLPHKSVDESLEWC